MIMIYFSYLFIICLLNINELNSVFASKCFKNTWCYGSDLCDRNKIIQNKIKPNQISKMTCFNQSSIHFTMGTNKPMFKTDGEAPSRTVYLSPFCIDQTQVSNEQFYQFVLENNYKTEAEKFGDSFCFVNLLSDKTARTVKNAAAQVPWWVVIKNATWMNPEGSDSSINNRMNHPVVHVSWNDANAYCKYFNKRLPTEAEWEYSCRGGLNDRLYPWGDLPQPNGKHMMNIWQGYFPYETIVEDGYKSTAPVDAFKQNKFNMYNIVGNVWEWVSDWWQINHPKGPIKDPNGAYSGTDKVKKGGSFMCTPSFCHRYRCAARSKNTPDTTAHNVGFRCAKNFN